MRFSQDFIDKVRDANSIVEILSEYTSFQQKGHQFMGRCPLPGHNEKTASFSVSEDKQVYHCFGCQKSGNIFVALNELKGLNFPEAVEHLAQRAGIDLPVDVGSANKSASNDNKKKLLNINKTVAEYYNKNLLALPEKHPVKQYCKKRNLSKGLIELFQIGFAEDKWESLANELDKRKIPRAQARELGLLRPRKEGGGDYDLYRNRLMFAIQDHRGEFIGFGGRALGEDQAPKYLNSHESDLFKKGSIFYGLHQSQQFIRQKDAVVVVEGYMDFLALYGAGIKNVVATLGTALTSNHARLLKRYTRNIVILFDGDAAGAKAAERSLPILLAEGLIPKGLVLSDEFDPDEFIQEKGVEELRKILVKAPELFNMQIERESKTFTGTSSDKLRLMDKFAPILNIISDSRLKSFYVDSLAKLLGVDLSWVESALSGAATAAAKSSVSPTTPKTAVPGPIVTRPADTGVLSKGAKIRIAKSPKGELLLLNLALLSPTRMNAIWEDEVVGEFTHPGVQELLVKAHQFYGQNPSQFDKLTAYLMSLTDTPNEVSLHLGQVFQGMSNEELDRMQADCVKQVRERHLKLKAREITARMRNQAGPEQLKELERFMNVQKAKKTLKAKSEIE
jgi:DNA primase